MCAHCWGDISRLQLSYHIIKACLSIIIITEENGRTETLQSVTSFRKMRNLDTECRTVRIIKASSGFSTESLKSFFFLIYFWNFKFVLQKKTDKLLACQWGFLFCFSNIAKEIGTQYLNEVRSEHEDNYTQHCISAWNNQHAVKNFLRHFALLISSQVGTWHVFQMGLCQYITLDIPWVGFLILLTMWLYRNAELF